MTRQNAEHGTHTVESDAPLGDWFRRTPESLRMLAEETEALRSAEDDAPFEQGPLANLLGAHIFLRGFTTIDGPQKSRCTCGHVYDNPNASEGFSHPRHVSDVLTTAGYTRVTPSAPTHADEGGA